MSEDGASPTVGVSTLGVVAGSAGAALGVVAGSAGAALGGSIVKPRFLR